MVHTYEIIASLDHLSLLRCESRQSTISHQLCHLVWVLSKNDRIIVPCELERHGPIGSYCISWVRNIVRQTEVNVSGQTDHTFLLGLIFSPVSLHSFSMRQDHVVSSDVWLCRVVATAAFQTFFRLIRASPWSMNSSKVTIDSNCPRLV